MINFDKILNKKETLTMTTSDDDKFVNFALNDIHVLKINKLNCQVVRMCLDKCDAKYLFHAGIRIIIYDGHFFISDYRNSEDLDSDRNAKTEDF